MLVLSFCSSKLTLQMPALLSSVQIILVVTFNPVPLRALLQSLFETTSVGSNSWRISGILLFPVKDMAIKWLVRYKMSGRLAQSGASLTANQGVAGSSPVRPHSFVEICHEKKKKKTSTTIPILPLIQEGQLSVTG